jgi:hypothetical protein
MDYRLDCEVRFADHARMTAHADADGWKRPALGVRYRVTFAKWLVALASRLAPMETAPNLTTQVSATR